MMSTGVCSNGISMMLGMLGVAMVAEAASKCHFFFLVCLCHTFGCGYLCLILASYLH